MPGKKPTQQELDQAAAIIAEQGNIGRYKLAEQMGVTPARAYTFLRALARSSPTIVSHPNAPKDEREYRGNLFLVNIDGLPFNDPDALADYLNINRSEWSCKRFKFKAYQRPDKESQEAKNLYSIEASFEKKQALVSAQCALDEFRQLAESYAPKYKPFKHKPSSGNMLELDIFDAHLGKLAWGLETGSEDYDLKIAEQRFEEAVETLIARTDFYGLDQILFTVGNDFWHTDNKAGTTTRGTQVDTDSRYQRTFRRGHELLVRTIDRLSAVAPVKIIVVPGNHDELSAWTEGFALECWYRHSTDVTIDNTPPLMKFHEWGDVMLMFCHGDKGKKKDYGMVMATTQPEMFGRTRHREAHTGHFHGDRVTSAYGVKVRTLRALCSVDAWHAQNMFMGQLEGAEAFVWNRDEGLIGGATYTVPRRRNN